MNSGRFATRSVPVGTDRRATLMLSYQHAFHAGNRADLVKHAVQHLVLGDLVTRHSAWLYVETHAGRGRYDLAAAEARKTAEHEDGISHLLALNRIPKPLQAFAAHIAADREHRGQTSYPGSPAIAASMLPAQARIVLYELHPAENAALQTALGGDGRIRIERSDGYLGALRLSPRRGEKLCLLVDPSYETANDILNVGNWVPRALSKWPDAVIMVWLPLFADAREAELLDHLAGFEPTAIAGTRWPMRPHDNKALSGSAMALFNISEAVADKAGAICDACHDLWWEDGPNASD